MQIFQKIVFLTFIMFVISLPINAAGFNVLVEDQEIAILSLPSFNRRSFTTTALKSQDRCTLIKHGGGVLQVTNLAPFSTIEIRAGAVQLIINPGQAILFDEEGKTLYCVQNISINQNKNNCCRSAWRSIAQKLSGLKRFLCCCSS